MKTVCSLLIAAVSALKIREASTDTTHQGDKCHNKICEALNGDWMGPNNLDLLYEFKGEDWSKWDSEVPYQLREKYMHDMKNEWGSIDWMDPNRFGEWVESNSSPEFVDNTVKVLKAWQDRKKQPGYWEAFQDGDREARYYAEEGRQWEYQRGKEDAERNCTAKHEGHNNTDHHHPAGHHHPADAAGVPHHPTDASVAPMCPAGMIMMGTECKPDTAADPAGTCASVGKCDGPNGCEECPDSGRSTPGFMPGHEPACPAGEKWNGQTCETDHSHAPGTAAPMCPAGMIMMGTECKPDTAAAAHTCPAGEWWNGQTCQSDHTHTAAGTAGTHDPACPAGEKWNGQNCETEHHHPAAGTAGAHDPACPAGEKWNGQTCETEHMAPMCPAGEVMMGTACVADPAAGAHPCPAGEKWNGQTCETEHVAPMCPTGMTMMGTACVAWDPANPPTTTAGKI